MKKNLNLRRKRQQMNKTLEDMHRETGIAASLLSAIERGQKPNFRLLDRMEILCKAYGVTREDIENGN